MDKYAAECFVTARNLNFRIWFWKVAWVFAKFYRELTPNFRGGGKNKNRIRVKLPLYRSLPTNCL